MKKTLITLLALSGLAIGANEENLMWTVDTSNNAYTTTSGAAWTADTPYAPQTKWSSTDFTTKEGYVWVDGSSDAKKVSFENNPGFKMAQDFTLSMDCIITGTPEGQDTLQLVQFCETVYWQLNVQYDTTKKAITFGGNYTLTDSMTYGSFEVTDITNVTVAKTGSLNKNGYLSVYVNGELAASTVIAASNMHANTTVNAGLIFLADRQIAGKGPIGGVSSVSLYNVAVPEPTTATLSLLALAGLAARRRRR